MLQPSMLKTGFRAVAFAVMDEELVVVHHNHTLAEWMRLDTAVDLPITQLFPEFIGSEESLKQNQTPFIIPRTHHTLHGQTAYLHLQIDPLPHQNPTQFLLTAVDITRQAEQEQRLQQQRNEVRLLYSRLQDSHAQLTYLLKRFVPTKVVEELITNQRMPKLGGEKRREATILFIDMRNFTSLAEQYTPEDTLDILNIYLDVIAQSIWKYDGSVIQIVGDMMMATFNAPDEIPDHALRAAQTALDIQIRLSQFIEANKEDIPILKWGTGIHTGQVTMGYLGVEERYRYAVFGDATNVAFHLCSQANGGQIIISHSTLRSLVDIVETTSLGDIVVKSRQKPLATYELHALKGLLA